MCVSIEAVLVLPKMAALPRQIKVYVLFELFFIFTCATWHGVSLFSELAKPFPLLIVQHNLITTEVPLLAKKFYMLNKKRTQKKQQPRMAEKKFPRYIVQPQQPQQPL